ncbi:non-canonical purine NTP pyrophosphatase [bacterium]|nr:non-canonical purine NTP pyrophosphatase [bacterium]
MLGHRPLLIASRNAGKIGEIAALLTDLTSETRSLLDFPELVPPQETAMTYHENAYQKAWWAHTQTGLPTLADDSGLEIKALDDKPGVLSARFLGETVSYQLRHHYILTSLDKLVGPKRAARFVCVVVLMLHDSLWFGTKGTVSGSIAPESRGQSGFGYDPIFIPDGYSQTFAELDHELKNTISHRALALKQICIFRTALL